MDYTTASGETATMQPELIYNSKNSENIANAKRSVVTEYIDVGLHDISYTELSEENNAIAMNKIQCSLTNEGHKFVKSKDYTKTEVFKTLKPIIYGMVAMGQFTFRSSENNSTTERNEDTNHGIQDAEVPGTVQFSGATHFDHWANNSRKKFKYSYDVDDQQELKKRNASCASHPYWIYLLRIYNFIVLGVMVSYIILGIIPLDFSGPVEESLFDNMYGLMIILWYTHCTIRFVILMMACWKNDAFPKFIVMWEELQKGQDDPEHLKGIRKQILKVMLLTWTFMAVQITAVTVGQMYTSRFRKVFTPWDAEETNTVLISLGFFANIIFSAAWVLPAQFSFVLSQILRAEFKLLVKTMTKANLSGSDELEMFRRRHQKIVHLVHIVDGFVGKMIAASFVFNITLSCLDAYTMIRNDMDTLTLLVFLFWFVAGIALLVIDCFAAGSVSVAVSQIIQLLSKVSTVVFKIIRPPPLAFSYDFYRNKSCNIDCYVNSMLPTNQNMIVSQGLELILSMFRRTTMSGQHPLI